MNQKKKYYRKAITICIAIGLLSSCNKSKIIEYRAEFQNSATKKFTSNGIDIVYRKADNTCEVIKNVSIPWSYKFEDVKKNACAQIRYTNRNAQDVYLYLYVNGKRKEESGEPGQAGEGPGGTPGAPGGAAFVGNSKDCTCSF